MSRVVRIPEPMAVYAAALFQIILGAPLIYQPDLVRLLVFYGFSILHSLGLEAYSIGALLIAAGLTSATAARLERRLPRRLLIAMFVPHFVLALTSISFNTFLLVQGYFDWGKACTAEVTTQCGIQRFDRLIAFQFWTPVTLLGGAYIAQVIDRYFVKWATN